MAQRSSAKEPRADPKKRSARQRRRSRYELERGDSHWVRLIVIVGAVGLVAAAILFWNRGGDAVNSGIGERLTVVTVDSLSEETTRPRSGSVAIEEHHNDLVPERPTGAQSGTKSGSSRAAASAAAASKPTSPTPPPAEQRRPEQRRQEPRSRESSEDQQLMQPVAPPLAEPSDQGAWALQVGAFGSKENAESLLASLGERGFVPKLRAESSANGEIFYRVWIGYFPSRAAAERYGRARTAELGETFPVHR